MELQARIDRQRVQHIIDSYQLQGNDPSQFQSHIEQLISIYQPSTIELAIVDTLITSWMHLPPVKGLEFIAALELRLTRNLPRIVTANQYLAITGLDGTPVLTTLVRPTS